MTGEGRRAQDDTAWLRFRAASAREVEEHAERGERGQHADELRGREDAGDDEAPHEVAAPHLDDAAGDRVEEDVQPEDLSVEGAPAVGPLQDEEYEEGVGGEVELCRVERDIQGGSDRVVREGVSPGQGR